MASRALTHDPWSKLRRETAARIALGRAGGSLPTAEVLDFAMAHAEARDAVHEELDVERLEDGLRPLGLQVLRLHSAAPDRLTYLRRPDLGRRLDDVSRSKLGAEESVDVAVIVADGLSAPAVHRQAAPLLKGLIPAIRASRLTLGPLTVVVQGRVAIEDEIGALLRASAAMILIGERPGLGSPDSLGAYLVFDPSPGKSDADRNCVSNIRPEGLPCARAAATIHFLLTEALRRRLSGVRLKDERIAALPSPQGG